MKCEERERERERMREALAFCFATTKVESNMHVKTS